MLEILPTCPGVVNDSNDAEPGTGKRIRELGAKALDKFAQDAKTLKLLDPTSEIAPTEMSGRWKIAVNTPVKRDS